jgi:hypothetical protein
MRSFIARVLFVLTAVACVTGQAIAQETPAPAATPAPDRWHFTLTPYVWFPNIYTTLNRPALLNGGGTVAIGVEPHQYLNSLRFASMLTGEARKDRLAIFSDVIYMNLTNSATEQRIITTRSGARVPITIDTQVRLTQGLWTLGGSYTLARSGGSSIDALLGFRLNAMGGTVGIQLHGPPPLPSALANGQQSPTYVDAIAGFRGQIALNDRWFIPYYADAGTGASDFTWQGAGGIGTSLGHGDLMLVYRDISYNWAGQNTLQRRMELSGPALGYRFKF